MDGTLFKEDIRIIKAQLYSKLKEEGEIINDSIENNPDRDFLVIKRTKLESIFS